MDDRLDLLLRERVRIAADEIAAAAPARSDVSGLVRKGMRQRRLHLASLAAALSAVVVLVAVVGLRLSPDAARAPSFYTAPSAGPSANPSDPAFPGPVSTLSRDPEPSATGSSGAVAEPTPSSSVPGCVPAPAVATPPGIEVRLTLDETIYARDADIRMALSVHNTSERSVTYQHSGQRYDFWITRDDGVVWTWAYDREFQAFLASGTIGPGERETAEAAWDQTMCAPGGAGIGPGPSSVERPPPGRYVARAMWSTNTGGWWSNPVEFVVL